MHPAVRRRKRPVITQTPLVSSGARRQTASNFPPMTILKIILGIFVAIVALTVFGKIQQKIGSSGGSSKPAPASSAKDPGLSPAGFFLLSRDDAKNPRVTIVSAPNCPSHEAQRAEALASALTSAGIPCELKQGIEFQFTDPADGERVNKYMANAANPVVLVRGWAKGSPTTDDVIAQYRSGQ
jgi:hypothetical protein